MIFLSYFFILFYMGNLSHYIGLQETFPSSVGLTTSLTCHNGKCFQTHLNIWSNRQQFILKVMKSFQRPNTASTTKASIATKNRSCYILNLFCPSRTLLSQHKVNFKTFLTEFFRWPIQLFLLRFEERSSPCFLFFSLFFFFLPQPYVF